MKVKLKQANIFCSKRDVWGGVPTGQLFYSDHLNGHRPGISVFFGPHLVENVAETAVKVDSFAGWIKGVFFGKDIVDYVIRNSVRGVQPSPWRTPAVEM